MVAIKAAVGAAAFAAPILMGFGFTAANTVGFEGFASGVTEDEIDVSEGGEEYRINLSRVGDAETLTVSDENGNVIAEDDYPDFVLEAIVELRASADAPDEELVGSADGSDGTLLRDLGGTFCYDEDVIASEVTGGAFDIDQSGSDGTYAVSVDESGQVDAVYMEGEVSHELFADHRESGIPYTEIEGAQPINAC